MRGSAKQQQKHKHKRCKNATTTRIWSCVRCGIIGIGIGRIMMNKRPKIPRPVAAAATAVTVGCEQGLAFMRKGAASSSCVSSSSLSIYSFSTPAVGRRPMPEPEPAPAPAFTSVTYVRGEVARRALLSATRRASAVELKNSVMYRRRFEHRPSRLSRVSFTDLSPSPSRQG